MTSQGLSEDGVAKIVVQTVAQTTAEILSKLNLGKIPEQSSASSVKHTIPILKKDTIDNYLAWSDAMKGLILQTDCGIALEESLVENTITQLVKHSELRNLDPNDITNQEMILVMKKNDTVMGYINSGLPLREHRNCVAGAKSDEFPMGIAYEALKKLRQHFIPDSTMQKAGLKRMLRGISMKKEDNPKNLGTALSRVKNMALEAGIKIDESDLVDQAMLALSKEYADAVIGAHRDANVKGEPTLNEIVQAARDHYEFCNKEGIANEKEEKKHLSLANMEDESEGDCRHCGKPGHKQYECPKKLGNKGNSGPQIKGTCFVCGGIGHKAAKCWEKEEDAHLRPKGWKSRMKKKEEGSQETSAANVELIL